MNLPQHLHVVLQGDGGRGGGKTFAAKGPFGKPKKNGFLQHAAVPHKNGGAFVSCRHAIGRSVPCAPASTL